MKNNMGNCGIYGVAAVGVAIYYIKHAASFGTGIIGVLKAMVWPAIAGYKIFQYMQW